MMTAQYKYKTMKYLFWDWTKGDRVRLIEVTV